MMPGVFAGAMMGGGGVPAVQTVWSATNKAADISLIDGNRQAHSSSIDNSGGTVVTEAGKTGGKYYAECIPTVLGGAPIVAFGLRRGVSSLSSYLGERADDWCVWAYGSGGVLRATYTGGTPSNETNPGGITTADYARLAVDLDAGKLWLAHFGSTAWVGGGDPAAGTSPTYTFSVDDEDVFFLAGCPRASGNTLKLRDPSEWGSSAPAGFGVWTS